MPSGAGRHHDAVCGSGPEAAQGGRTRAGKGSGIPSNRRASTWTLTPTRSSTTFRASSP